VRFFTHLACLVLGLAVLLALPEPVRADPPTGSRIDRSSGGLTGRFNPRHATSPRPGIQAYLRCVASLNRSRAGDVVALPYDSEEQLEAANRMTRRYVVTDERVQDCFSNFGDRGMQIGYSSLSAVGAYSEYLALENFDRDDVAAISALTRDDWQRPELKPRNGGEAVGMCFAQAHGLLVYDLLETEAESDEEQAAIAAIAPQLGPCIPEGVEIAFDVNTLRAMLAHGLHRTLSQIEALQKGDS
jgi:hypothetical protein